MKEIFQKLISLNFWFDVDRAMYHKSDFIFLTIGALILLAAIAVQIFIIKGVHPVSLQPIKRIRKVLFWTGLLLTGWFLFRWQFIPFFGTHAAWLAIFIIGVIWYAVAIRYFASQHSTDKEKYDKQQQKLKYLQR